MRACGSRGGRSTAGITAVLLLIGAHAEAQQPATTLLRLSATSSVQANPDQLVADLLAQGTSPSAATAQRRVNSLIAAASQEAQNAAGITTTVAGYSVVPSDEKRTGWVAQQVLELRGADGPSLLDLVGRLQQQGLTVASLDWQLSPALRTKAHDQATTEALGVLQERAASAARALGLHVDHVQEVRLDEMVGQPRPLLTRSMAATGFSSAPPPQATPAQQDVTATVTAEVVLRP